MFRIAAFRPLRYDPEKISFISRVVAPPYDLIDEGEAEALRQRDQHNVIRLILGKEGAAGRAEDEYAEAAATLAAWRQQGVLIREAVPSVYVCEQSFVLDGRPFSRHGLICAMLLDEFSSGGILPHEQTLAGPKADRLRLMSACRAALSPILGVFSDVAGAADDLIRVSAAGLPLYEFCGADNVAHRVWRVSDQDTVRQLAQLLVQERLLIADGHHRYEAALEHRRRQRSGDGPPGSAPEDFTVVFCVSAKDPGLCIQPTHRLVAGRKPFAADAFLRALGTRFRITELPVKGPQGLTKAYRRGTDAPGWFAAYLPRGRFLLLRPSTADPLAETLPNKPPVWRQLPVTLLHRAILEPLMGLSDQAGTAGGRLAFTQNVEHVYWRVESGRYDIGFLLPPIAASAVEAVALVGERMPPKSTFFWPKVPSGLLFYPFDNGEHLPRLPGV